MGSNNFRKKKLIDKLLNDQSHHIEFNGHLTNHNKHAVVALNGLGASWEKIKSYYEAYAICTPYGYGLEPPKSSKYIITQDNWQLYLGKRTSFSSYYQFFDQQEKELGLKNLLNKYVPILLPGWAGSLTHAAIHLGWGLDVNNRCMIIEGLAYMAFSYVSCFPERASTETSNAMSHRDVWDSVYYIAQTLEQNYPDFKQWVEETIAEHETDLHPELMRSGLQYRVAKLLRKGHPLIYALPYWVEKEDISNIWQQLHYVVTLLYMTKPGDFFILHLLTSLHAMEFIAKHLSVEQKRYTLKCFWIGMLCLLFAQEEFPNKMQLEALNIKYKNDFDDRRSVFREREWQCIIDRALHEEEEHNPKLVYVLYRMWKISHPRAIFRIAAAYFTTTPILPKSFENPPVDVS